MNFNLKDIKLDKDLILFAAEGFIDIITFSLIYIQNPKFQQVMPFIFILICILMQYLAHKLKIENAKVKDRIENKYTEVLYYASFIVNIAFCALVLNGLTFLYNNVFGLVAVWIVPYIAYMYYSDAVLLDRKEMRIKSQRVFYKDIRKYSIKPKRSKELMTIRTSDAVYYYRGKHENVAKIEDVILKRARKLKMKAE